MEEVEMAGSSKELSCITYIWNPKKVKPVKKKKQTVKWWLLGRQREAEKIDVV